MTTTHYEHFIDGRPTAASGRGRIQRASPGNGLAVATFADGGVEDVELAVKSARDAWHLGNWRDLNATDRAGILRRVAEFIRRDTNELAQIEALESGKPITQARDEMGWAAGLWDYAATLAVQLHGDSYNTLGRAHLGLTLREPLGVVALVTPWNFPLLIISQKLPFALAAGCTCVVKPSELTSGTTLRLAALLIEAGLPPGVCNVVTGYGHTAGQRLAEHPLIQGISFTGSTAVGQRIVAAASANLKRVSLELGGKNAQIVFPDADLDAAADAVVFGFCFNAGQCCNSGSRLLLHRDVPTTFLAKVADLTQALRVGDPMSESTRMGAIISPQHHTKITSYLELARSTGVRTAFRGEAPAGPGNFIPPTVLESVPLSSRLFTEEIFGPVLSVTRFATDAEALALANATNYGLSASIWTRDVDRATQFARGIEAGTVWINTFMDGFPQIPFGGYKQSGWHRELGRDALHDYTEVKSVVLHQGPRTGMWCK